ncbi:MAG: BamA/TamA family outer membrane protein [Deltaproteobacteria bacterium]|nr:BamA/TamA family outer membrane protein [Deltaproteobacteria bacterium]
MRVASVAPRASIALLLVALGLVTSGARAQPDHHASASSESPDASGDEGSFGRAEEPEPFEWFALPLVGYSSDVGLAGVLLAGFVWNEDGREPYRDRLQIVSSVTTKRVIYDEIRYEHIGLFDRPLRLSIVGRFVATTVSNYCGLGDQVSCSRDVARAAASDAGLMVDTPDFRRFVRRYYRLRVTRPELFAGLRYLPRPGGVELRVGWHLAYEIPSFFRQSGPFAGSLYAQDYPGGEEGLRSELQLGVLLDRRDDERRPSSGYVLDASFRGAASFVGSAWDYAGVTLGGAFYLSLDRGRRYVWATRLVADLLVGSPPTAVLGSVGGFWSEIAYGGQYMGRGIRARRYIGRIKVIGQTELRATLFGDPKKFSLMVLAFVDAGYVGVGYRDFGGDPERVLLGFGGGVGAHWGSSFVLRFDVGTSALERYSPSFYLTLSHPY